ncbi:SH3-domain-containing protein [Parathielavia appendiculata]|uniref:SH3-domain-containing protein n=1 Tax=Parathielavia appendiculata TaxID=2587402 RepID=A0AAN6U211_9PEZI|nr:SH3-domain-containing protein [Parathielavia appendiculata]
MVSEDRQRIIETNRSLRLIKNELESLLEKGVITDSAFDSISALLPAESPLSGGPVAAARTDNANSSLPTPSPSNPSPAPAVSPPTYAQSTAPPPSLPVRNNPPPPPADSRPILTHARGLYRYAGTDARDVSFERDDRIAVLEYMNADWWMGRNLRTGQEGIFPRSYVVEEQQSQEKMPVAGYPQQPQYAAPASGHYPIAPVPVGGYGQQQQQQQESGGGGGSSKIEEHGKKFGKKLGNAAIFGAGATIGSNIVNSIF